MSYYLSDTANKVIRKVDDSGIITTLALTSSDPVYIANGGLTSPFGMAVDPAGNIFVVDQGAAVIYKIDTSGVVTRVVGTGVQGFSGDGGAAISAELYLPYYLALDSAGNLYFSDTPISSGPTFIVRAINMQATTQTLLGVSIAAGNIQTVAGTPGTSSHTGMGGPAISATLEAPFGVAIDAAGNLYIADQGGIADGGFILKVDTTGIINVFAGTGSRGFSGDAGPVAAAQINLPIGVTLDDAGNVYITDTFNQRVRVVNMQGTTQTILGQSIASGNIQTVAGNGTPGYMGDGGPATSAELNSPWTSRAQSTGDLYIADNLNFVIRKVDSTTGIISTVVGNHTAGYSGDNGPATSAEIQDPFESVAFAPSGPVTGNIVIAKTTVPAGSSQSFEFTPSYGSVFDLTDGETNDSGPLAPGTYQVLETPVPGWTTATSQDPSNIIVVAGETTTVTFTNTLTPLPPPPIPPSTCLEGAPLLDGNGQPRAPQVMLRWSDDAGKTWSNTYLLNCGKVGEFQARARKTQLGRARRRVWEVSGVDQIPWRIADAYVEATPSTAIKG